MTTNTNAHERAYKVARTIAAQIGPRAFVMLGTMGETIMAGEHDGMPCLRFRFRGSKRGNMLRVCLDEGRDTYRVDLAKIGTGRSGFRVTDVERVSDVHVGELRQTIERMTGLAISL